MQTEIILTRETLYILNRLRQAGYDAYLVGGAVRDLFLGKNPYQFDMDFATNASPEQIQQVFPNSFYENDFGTVSMTIENLLKEMNASHDYHQALALLVNHAPVSQSSKIIDLSQAEIIHPSLANQANITPPPMQPVSLPNFEITTYRSQEVYTIGSRKPQSLEWGKTIEEDLKRRDFTINAIALTLPTNAIRHLLEEVQTKNSLFAKVKFAQLIIKSDPTALPDLNKGIIKSVDKPADRFNEDALRMLRAIRLAVQLGMEIDAVTLAAINTCKTLISEVSFERIRDELLKMIQSKMPKRAILLLDQTGLLDFIIPELTQAKGVQQGGHHTSDVWTHSLDALGACPSIDPIVRLATLLHDIAKPMTYKLVAGTPTFYNHEVIGARVARDIGRRLRLSKQQIDRLFTLVRFHMFHYQEHNTDAAIRRFMRKVGLENIDDILDLREGDRLGSGARKTSWRLEEMKQRMIEQLHQPLTTHDLAVDGYDLMHELDLKPGPVLGAILSRLLEQVLDNPKLNTKPQLLKIAKTLL